MVRITTTEHKALVELSARKNMAIKMFRPLPHQDVVFDNPYSIFLCRGGNRCTVSGTTFVAVNKDGSATFTDKLSVGQIIVGVNPFGYLCPTEVKDIREFRDVAYRLTTQDGHVLEGTQDHPVMIGDGESMTGDWVELLDVKAGMLVRSCQDSGWMGWSVVESVECVGEKDIYALTTDNETYISNGIVSHNSGKSTTCAVKFAATATDIPVILSDGRVVHQRREHQRGKKLDMWVIGYDWTHIGMTIYRLLFRGGLFKVIFDEELGEYRAFRPNDPKDQGREKSAIDSPPLIPTRYVKPDSWAWENKKLRQFKKVDIWNPETQEILATIYAFPSTAEAKAGDIVDCIWIDEKIENADHFDEWKARLTDREGHLFWSSWPSVENDALRNITDEAEKQKDYEKPEFGEAILKFSDNTALPQHLVDKRLSQFTSEAEKLARDKGEYVTGLLKMYPEFSEYTHDVFSYDDELARAISKNGGVIPSDWTRELILDPGSAHPFVLLCAVPPPNLGDFLVPYDEVSMENVDAFRLADVTKKKLKGYPLNRMIIDGHASRQTPMGFGHTVGKQYKQAFEYHKIRLYNGGTYFVDGCDNVSGRISALQIAMSKEGRVPRLRIMTKQCPVLVKQLKRYLKRVIKKEVEEFEPMPRQQIDAAVCAEYWVSSHPRYVKPKTSAKTIEDMDDFEYDEAFFNDDHDRRASGRGGAMIGPQYHVAGV